MNNISCKTCIIGLRRTSFHCSLIIIHFFLSYAKIVEKLDIASKYNKILIDEHFQTAHFILQHRPYYTPIRDKRCFFAKQYSLFRKAICPILRSDMACFTKQKMRWGCITAAPPYLKKFIIMTNLGKTPIEWFAFLVSSGLFARPMNLLRLFGFDLPLNLMTQREVCDRSGDED